MPSYTFENTKTGKVWDDYMSISDKEKYLKKNKNIKQLLTKVNIVSGVSGMSYRTDGGWNETLSKIAEHHPNTPLADQMKTTTTKQIKTKQVIKKHVARQNAKNK
tara:strand:+ start:307 stop:621 length:315 start_codon:yes stop_codon:yes gene_type:complete